jgi:hypothetical protein
MAFIYRKEKDKETLKIEVNRINGRGKKERKSNNNENRFALLFFLTNSSPIKRPGHT